jgi:hypothetical protein
MYVTAIVQFQYTDGPFYGTSLDVPVLLFYLFSLNAKVTRLLPIISRGERYHLRRNRWPIITQPPA